MPEIEIKKFYPLIPGSKIEGDWYPGMIPDNIDTGENTVIDSSFCFKNYFSRLPVGLRVGSHVTFWRTSIAAEENALIEIGNFCYIANASLVCSKSITIGDRVVISGGVTIADSDFHPLEPAARIADTIALSPLGNREQRPAIQALPVVIGADTWIGYNATILKGVCIGEGAIIQPGSVVIHHVEPGTIVAGNPAKLISDIA
jgi:acetyltransferase-like isoleucine patch superfamily enzyme